MPQPPRPHRIDLSQTNQVRGALNVAILTAGESRRLGQPKQHLEFNGRSLLQRAVELARDFLATTGHAGKPIVVSGAYLQQDCQALLALGLANSVEHHCNSAWKEGLSTSRHVAREAASTDGLLLLLVDQYRLEIADLLRVYQAWQLQPERPSIASFSDTIGPPVILPAFLGTTESPQNAPPQNTGQARAGKQLITASNPALVPVSNAEYDLDTPSDLAAARAFFERHA